MRRLIPGIFALALVGGCSSPTAPAEPELKRSAAQVQQRNDETGSGETCYQLVLIYNEITKTYRWEIVKASGCGSGGGGGSGF